MSRIPPSSAGGAVVVGEAGRVDAGAGTVVTVPVPAVVDVPPVPSAGAEPPLSGNPALTASWSQSK